MHKFLLHVVLVFVALHSSFAQTNSPSAIAQAVCPQTGQKVAFLGDSITAFGWGKPAGYVHLVAMALEQQGDKVEVVPAGVSGNTSKDMLARLDASVLSKKPDWMTLSCGVNDVWHGANGVPLDGYQQNITSIVDQATAAGIKVVILTSTLIGEDDQNDNNKKAVPYNDFLRTLAKQRRFPLADLNAAEVAELAGIRAASPNLKGTLMTVDGVHMNPIGDQMMASGILKAWGFTDAQLGKAREAWLDIANGVDLNGKTSITPRQYEQLTALAASQGKSVNDLVGGAFNTAVESVLKDASAVPAPSPKP